MKGAFLLLLFLPFPALSHNIPASPDLSCESALNNEFARKPDDQNNGLVSQQVPITVPALINAYKRGIFPWGVDMAGYGRWHRPPMRGVLDLNEVHIGRSDAKFLRHAEESGEFRVTFNEAFKEVVEQCASVPRFRTHPHTGQKIADGAWISPEFIDAYTRLHYLGHAHSVEVWRAGRLVGGLYGVFVGGVFTGESMFHLEDDVTKLAMVALIERLKAGGHRFLDTQMALGLAKKWGAKLIPRAEFERRLAQAQQQNLKF